MKVQVTRQSAARLAPMASTEDSSTVRTYLEGEDREKRIPLKADLIRVGSNSDCSIVLDDPTVSQSHAVFRNIEGRWLLQDLGSTNGTWVNGKQIDRPTGLNSA